MGRTLYLPTFGDDFDGINVDKYSSPMDGMDYDQTNVSDTR